MKNNDCNCFKNNIDPTEMEKISKIKKVIKEYKNVKGALIPVLHKAQEIYGYLPLKIQKIISDEMKMPLAEIYGVVTFYSQFLTVPKGNYKIQVCLGTACYVKGSGKVIEKISQLLGVEVGKSTKDGKFSLDAVRCIGACGLAPVMMINDDVYGQMTPEQVEDILKKY